MIWKRRWKGPRRYCVTSGGYVRRFEAVTPKSAAQMFLREMSDGLVIGVLIGVRDEMEGDLKKEYYETMPLLREMGDRADHLKTLLGEI